MEMNETVLCMCRLCLNYTGDCTEIVENNAQNVAFQGKLKKYLTLEINKDEPYPKTVCQQCIDRIEIFDKFCIEVIHHQQILQMSKSKEQNSEPEHTTTSTRIVQLSPTLMTKENGTIIITLQTSTTTDDAQDIPSIQEIDILALNPHRTSKTYVSNELNSIGSNVSAIGSTEIEIQPHHGSNGRNESVDSTLIHYKSELENLVSEQINDGSDDEDDDDLCNEDENETHDGPSNMIDNLTINHEKFRDFPKKLIENTKLLFKGRELIEIISKFYRLVCDLCGDKSEGTIFDSISELCQHYVDCHQMKGYVICCSKKLIKLRAMALHMARHIQPEEFKCSVCNKMLTCPKILKYHLQNHLPETQRPLACPQCPRRFSYRHLIHLPQHLNVIGSNSIYCSNSTNISIQYSSALVAHSISHQPESERACHVCDECGKVFASAGRLTTHINVSHMQQSQDHSCHVCAKKFACRSNLTYHLTTHQPKVRQVQCSKCGKWLKNKLCLRKHMVQHSSIRYNCSICDYSALNRQCLRNHMRVQHTAEKPFRCDVCDKTFKLKNTLINHSVQHTGVRKFVCQFCNRSFASSGNFYSHRKRMHPQELVALKRQQEEDERRLREEAKNSVNT